MISLYGTSLARMWKKKSSICEIYFYGRPTVTIQNSRIFLIMQYSIKLLYRNVFWRDCFHTNFQRGRNNIHSKIKTDLHKNRPGTTGSQEAVNGHHSNTLRIYDSFDAECCLSVTTIQFLKERPVKILGEESFATFENIFTLCVARPFL